MLFYAQIRAFRKLRSLERQEACCKYLIYRFPSEYQLVRGTKNAVEKRYVAADVQRRKEDHRFKIRIPCRVQGIGVDDFSSDEPMDIDIEVKADDSFDAVCAVENAIKALITKKD